MFVVLAFLAAGVVIGFFLGQESPLARLADKLGMWTVYLLLFLFGLSAGGNERLASAMGGLWLDSMVIAVSALIGSVLATALAVRLVDRASKAFSGRRA